MSAGAAGGYGTTVEAEPVAAVSPVAFTSDVRLSKREVFEACQALADADQVLVATGSLAVAGALGDLFELLEQRLTAG